MDKCCVCNNTKNLSTCKSTLINKFNTYCANCLLAGFEPYADLVSFGWTFEAFNQTFQQKIILPTLSANNKTIQQFNEEVKNRLENE